MDESKKAYDEIMRAHERKQVMEMSMAQYFQAIVRPGMLGFPDLCCNMARYRVNGTDEEFDELMVWHRKSGDLAKGYNIAMLRQMYGSKGKDLCATLWNIVSKAWHPSVSFYLLSPAEQLRIALGKHYVGWDEALVKGGVENLNAPNPNATSALTKAFEESAAEKADRLKIASRRSFDEQYVRGIMAEYERQKQEEGSKLLIDGM